MVAVQNPVRLSDLSEPQPDLAVLRPSPDFYATRTPGPDAATDATTGNAVQLRLTDPDSNFVMPAVSPRFADQLAQVSQGDGVVVFAAGLPARPTLTELTLSDGTGSAPSLDGMAAATSTNGTLFIVDRAHNTIDPITRTDPAGTTYVTEDSGSGHPLIGTLDLSTGAINPFASGGNPKGILFVPSPS